MVQQNKINLVQKLLNLLEKSQNFALVQIDKTTHQSLESLRKELKKNQSTFKVVKNSLLEKSILQLTSRNKLFEPVKKTHLPLKETSALLLLGTEWSKGLSAFYQFTKKEGTLSFKFGLLDGKTYPKDELLTIAKLPSKNQLLANLIGSLKSPTSKFIFSLKFNTTKLVYILKEKSKKSN